MLEQLIDRETRLENLKLDLEDQKDSRYRYQQEANHSNYKVKCLERKIVSPLDESSQNVYADV